MTDAHALTSPETIGYGRPCVDEDDVQAVADVLRTPFLTQGSSVPRFEERLAETCGAPFAVAASNGSAALHLAYLGVGLGPGKTLLTTANTFLSTATAAVWCGARVEFVDVERTTWNLDLDLLAERLEAGPVPDVVCVVYFAGLPCDMERVLELKRRYGFRLVEDAAHALGATYTAGGETWRVGENPEVDATCLSFHAVKHVTTGEGGAVLTHDSERARRLRSLRAHGVEPAGTNRPFATTESGGPSSEPPGWFVPMTELGFNYRLSDIHATLGTSQVAKLPRFLSARRRIAERYLERLPKLPALELPPAGTTGGEHTWHLFTVHVEGEKRDAWMGELAARGIRTQVHYYPVPMQPWFRERGDGRWFPAAEEHARRTISLPIYPGLSEANQDRVIGALTALACE